MTSIFNTPVIIIYVIISIIIIGYAFLRMHLLPVSREIEM